MAIFGELFGSCISSEPRAARFRPASEIRTKATPCVEVWQTYNLRRLRLGEEKEEDRKKKPQGKNIMLFPIPQGDHNNDATALTEADDRRSSVVEMPVSDNRAFVLTAFANDIYNQ